MHRSTGRHGPAGQRGAVGQPADLHAAGASGERRPGALGLADVQTAERWSVVARLLGRAVGDIDIATPLPPDEVVRRLTAAGSVADNRRGPQA